MRVRLFPLLLLLVSNALFAQLKSPDDFLGYQLGSKFTPHYKIVNYFNQAAAAMPQMMKLEKYGETNEGRELLLAIVASPENITRLDEIRKTCLGMIFISDDYIKDKWQD